VLERFRALGGAQSYPSRTKDADGVESHGTLYTRGFETCVALMMHPRGDMQRHYAMPRLLEAGIATFGQAGRFINNDVTLSHERIIVDIAAAVRQLKDRGFRKIVLLGNSGGGALYSFYQSQAQTSPPGRLVDTAAGDHLGYGPGGNRDRSGQNAALDVIVPWIKERFA